jgi:hypothetical protein
MPSVEKSSLHKPDDELAEMSMNATAPQSLRSFGYPSVHGTTELTIPKTQFLAEKHSAVPAKG